MLISKLDNLNRQLDALLEEMEYYSYEELNHHPKPGAWSAIQVMHHLMLSELLSLKYCQKKLSYNPRLKKAGALAWLRSAFIRGYLGTSIKFKAPKGVRTESLPQSDSLDQVSPRWLSQRQELRSFLDQVPDDYLDKEVYKHPFAGRMSLSGMLDFFEAHFHHHLPQIKRTLPGKQ